MRGDSSDLSLNVRATRTEHFAPAAMRRHGPPKYSDAPSSYNPGTIKLGFHCLVFLAMTRAVEPMARSARTSQPGKLSRIVSLACLAIAAAFSISTAEQGGAPA